MNDKITTLPRIYKTTQVCSLQIDDVLVSIKTGTFFGQDLKGITAYIRSLPTKGAQGEAKKWNLPVALFNGKFNYKDSDNLTEYSNYTALDFDNFQSEEELCSIGRRLLKTPCVFAIYRTPSGKGLKAIIEHDNRNPEYHEELYQQLLKKFNIPQTDASCSDLARGNYMCYDPNMWRNCYCRSYHFVHNPAYIGPSANKGAHTKAVVCDIGELHDMLSVRPVEGKKSDRSIIAILNAHWRKDESRWKEGGRANAVFSSASQFCMAGVDIDTGIDWLLNAYLKTGLGEDEILYHGLRGYQLNAEDYGKGRSRFDSYGKRR